MCGAPKYLIDKLQMVQNAAAQAVTKTGKYDHISDKLCDLKWLPVCFRIKYKVNLLTWKALNNQAPGYIASMVTGIGHGRAIRSKDLALLKVTATELITMGDKSFSYNAPVCGINYP